MLDLGDVEEFVVNVDLAFCQTVRSVYTSSSSTCGPEASPAKNDSDAQVSKGKR